MAAARVIRMPEVLRRVGVSRATVYRWIANGAGFPRPVKLGVRAVGWRSDEIEAWLADLPSA